MKGPGCGPEGLAGHGKDGQLRTCIRRCWFKGSVMVSFVSGHLGPVPDGQYRAEEWLCRDWLLPGNLRVGGW